MAPGDRLRRNVAIPLHLNWAQATAIDLPIGTEMGATSNGNPIAGHITGSITPLWRGTYTCGAFSGRVFGGTTASIDRDLDFPAAEDANIIASFADRWRLALLHQRQQPQPTS